MTYKLVEVRWMDAFGGVNSGWRPLTDMKKAAQGSPAKSVGWLIFENDEIVKVCPHLVGESDEEGDGEITIPKDWVSKITEIGPKRAKR